MYLPILSIYLPRYQVVITLPFRHLADVGHHIASHLNLLAGTVPPPSSQHWHRSIGNVSSSIYMSAERRTRRTRRSLPSTYLRWSSHLTSHCSCDDDTWTW